MTCDATCLYDRLWYAHSYAAHRLTQALLLANYAADLATNASCSRNESTLPAFTTARAGRACPKTCMNSAPANVTRQNLAHGAKCRQFHEKFTHYTVAEFRLTFMMTTSSGVTLQEHANEISPLTLSFVLRRPRMYLCTSATPLAPVSSTSRSGISTSPRNTSWLRRERPYTEICITLLTWFSTQLQLLEIRNGTGMQFGGWVSGDTACM